MYIDNTIYTDMCSKNRELIQGNRPENENITASLKSSAVNTTPQGGVHLRQEYPAQIFNKWEEKGRKMEK